MLSTAESIDLTRPVIKNTLGLPIKCFMNKNNHPRASHPASQKLTEHAKKSLLEAERIARQFSCPEPFSVHLLLAIFRETGSLGSNILKTINLKEKDFLHFLSRSLAHSEFHSGEIKRIFTRAYSTAKNLNSSYVGTEHLVLALMDKQDVMIKELMADSKIKNSFKFIKSFFEPGHLPDMDNLFSLSGITLNKTKKQKLASAPFIKKFCVNVNEEAQKEKTIVIGREKEIQRMINILGRKNKNNPLLIGEPGVGKTILVTGLAQLINSGSIPTTLYKKRIMGLDVAQLIAGTSFRGEFESRLKEIIKEAEANEDVIIFIDEIHNIVGAGNVAGSLDMANIIKPALARGDIQVIGATTLMEYKKYIEKDAALERRFQPIQIKEPAEDETRKILFGIRESYEKFHNVSISDSAIGLAVDLSVRYIQNRFLPDKAIDVIDETASFVRFQSKVSDFIKEIRELETTKQSLLEEKERLVSEENYEKAISLRTQEKELEDKLKKVRDLQAKSEKEHRISISDENIIETISRISGVSSEKLLMEKNQKIKNIKKILASRVIGQNEVIGKLSDALLRSQSGIGNPDRPLGSFLFLGPTGVGKTLTAKVLAEEFFGSTGTKSGSLVRIDMSELMERHSVSALIGSPAGYVGYGEGGNLTEKIRRNPYSVVLFDEIEKAHPDVFNILLQILEDGTLTDAEGTQVSFKNAIIILTSNIGTAEFTSASGNIGFSSPEKSKSLPEKFEAIKKNVIRELENKMKPELLNRLDYVLVFNALGKNEIKKITELELKKLSVRLKKQNVKINFDEKVINLIAEKSLGPKQGARMIRKNVQELLENPIAEMIVYDKVKSGKIEAKIEKGKIILT